MLQSEFETHTDIFPDVLLYEAEQEKKQTELSVDPETGEVKE